MSQDALLYINKIEQKSAMFSFQVTKNKRRHLLFQVVSVVNLFINVRIKFHTLIK